MNKTLILNPPIFVRIKLTFFRKILWILIIASVFSLLITCIFQLNVYTREFFLIQNYEKKLTRLSQENKILGINFSNANSLEKVGVYLQSQVFEKVGRVEYIQLLEGTALAK